MGANMAIMDFMVKIAIMALPSGHKYYFYGCLKKEWPKCRSPMKTVMKKMDHVKRYDQNKKKLMKMVIFEQIPL